MPTRDEPVYLRVESEHILGTLITPGTLIPGVLFVHGWGGDQRQYLDRAHELAALGCVCLTFDLRGHAQTKSRYQTVSREEGLRDILAAYDFLAAQHNVDADSVAVVGSSYGGYLASLLTGLRPVKWLALRAPALYKDSDWRLPKHRLNNEQKLELYRRQPVRPEESRALRACAAFTGDVLIVESEQDTVVPHQVVVNYREACVTARSLTYRVIPGANHALTGEASQRAYTSVLVTWLTEMVFGTRAAEGSATQTTPLANSPLDPAHQQHDDEHEHQQPGGPTRIVAPAAAVPPGRKRADQDQDQDDKKDRSNRHVVVPFGGKTR
jgi:pimeloyl-ACP methyl ester carboxylesterase